MRRSIKFGLAPLAIFAVVVAFAAMGTDSAVGYDQEGIGAHPNYNDNIQYHESCDGYTRFNY